MTREELRRHCLKQIKGCEMWAKHKGEEPHGKIYEEHKLILELLEQEPKTGHWILTSDDDYEYCTCSECGYQNGENWMIGSQIEYCSHCGAKMQEVEE